MHTQTWAFLQWAYNVDILTMLWHYIISISICVYAFTSIVPSYYGYIIEIVNNNEKDDKKQRMYGCWLCLVICIRKGAHFTSEHLSDFYLVVWAFVQWAIVLWAIVLWAYVRTPFGLSISLDRSQILRSQFYVLSVPDKWFPRCGKQNALSNFFGHLIIRLHF